MTRQDGHALTAAFRTARHHLDEDRYTGARVELKLGSVTFESTMTDVPMDLPESHRTLLLPTDRPEASQPRSIVSTRANEDGQFLRLTQGRLSIDVPTLYNPLLAEALSLLTARVEEGQRVSFQPGYLLLCHENQQGESHAYGFQTTDRNAVLQVIQTRWRGRETPRRCQRVTLDLEAPDVHEQLINIVKRLSVRTGPRPWQPESPDSLDLLHDLEQLFSELNGRTTGQAPKGVHRAVRRWTRRAWPVAEQPPAQHAAGLHSHPDRA